MVILALKLFLNIFWGRRYFLVAFHSLVQCILVNFLIFICSTGLSRDYFFNISQYFSKYGGLTRKSRFNILCQIHFLDFQPNVGIFDFAVLAQYANYKSMARVLSLQSRLLAKRESDTTAICMSMARAFPAFYIITAVEPYFLPLVYRKVYQIQGGLI